MPAVTLLVFISNTVWAVVVLLIWIAIVFWPARVAARKGHSFILFFLFSLVFFFLVLLVVYIVPNKNKAHPAAAAPSDE